MGVSLIGKSCHSGLNGDLADQKLHDAFRVASNRKPLRDGCFGFGIVWAEYLERDMLVVHRKTARMEPA